jgi:hypothetical protein
VTSDCACSGERQYRLCTERRRKRKRNWWVTSKLRFSFSTCPPLTLSVLTASCTRRYVYVRHFLLGNVERCECLTFSMIFLLLSMAWFSEIFSSHWLHRKNCENLVYLQVPGIFTKRHFQKAKSIYVFRLPGEGRAGDFGAKMQHIWLIEGQAFSPSYDLAPHPPTSASLSCQ